MIEIRGEIYGLVYWAIAFQKCMQNQWKSMKMKAK